jgi:hypothetical protein
MIIVPAMLVEPAKQAGMKVPDDPENFKPAEFPHFHVFSIMQLGSSLPYSAAHWDNAKLIAQIPDDKIKEVTVADVLNLGFAHGKSKP